jgi:probable rRNA maturation factor
MDIIFQVDEPFQADVDPAIITEALESTLALVNRLASAAPVRSNSVTVVVTDNATLQQLNHQYRGLNAPTDVLSFENVPDPDFPAVDEDMLGYLGEIVIAYPVAQVQALAAGHTVQAEITLLAVHGLLHLFGFDHDTPENKKKMWATQHQVMAELGLAHVQPTES